jgi:photosystem II stability/assembly factor-like uncharacterized protein
MMTISKNIFILCVLMLPIYYGCSKNSSPDEPPVAVDTLGAGWKKISVPDINFNDIFFITNNTGFAVAGSDIFKSSDGGNNWQPVYHSPNGFVNIAMGNESNIVFVTYTSKIIFTKDGGNSFDSVTIMSDVINDAYFGNATTVYAVGKSFWKSTNAGSTWTKLYDFPSMGYKSLHFLTDQIGWMAGTGGVFKTTNGGVTWEQKTVAPGFDFSSSVGSVYFIDGNTGYISDGSHIGKTTNGGTSWSRIFTANSPYQDLHFVSATTGYFTDSKYIYKTIDGGTTWNKEVALQNKTIIELHFTDATHGWACGTGGVILKFQN